MTSESKRFNGYDLALEAYRNIHDHHQQPLEYRLNALRLTFKKLRRSYRERSVRVSYDGDVAKAYLLGYVPPYIFLSEYVFREIGFLNETESDDFGIVGVGPGPELVALMKVLTDQNGSADGLTVRLYDIDHSTWTEVRQALTAVAVAAFDILNFESQIVPFDLDQPIDADFMKRHFQKTQNLVFQNCLNELKNRNIALANLRSIWNVIGEGSLVLFIEQRARRYDTNILLSQFKEHAMESGLVTFNELPKHRISFTDEVHPNLKQHFFGTYEDDLMERKNIDFDAMMFGKGPTV